MIKRSEETTIRFLVFHGHYEQDEQYTYAICDKVPVAAPGKDKDQARAAVDDALEVYLRTLSARDELDAAIEEYGIPVVPIQSHRPLPSLSMTEHLFERLVPA